MSAGAERPEQVLATVRRAVRAAIEETPALRQDPALERRIANKMVGISLAAADLLAEERRMSDHIAARAPEPGDARDAATAAGLAQGQQEAEPPTLLAPEPDAAPLAVAANASQIHGMSAVRGAAGTLRATRDAIDFPGFVTSLITGVFQSVQTSNIQQLQAFSDLLEAVSGSLGDFAATQITDERARAWAAGRFPQLAIEGEGEGAHLALKPNTEPPPAQDVARILEAKPGEVRSLDGDDVDGTLVPLVRRKLARDRQSMLSTMILMGMQRIVVDDGFIQASMDLRVDARSTAERTQAEQADARVETEASGSFGMGMWGASAKLAASVGYVKSDEQFTREDIAVSAGLRSNVQVRFHTEPLDNRRMASDRTLDRLKDQAMVPATEKTALLDSTRATTAPKLPTPAGSGSLLGRDAGTMNEAVNARERAAKEEQAKPKDGGGDSGKPVVEGGGDGGGGGAIATDPKLSQGKALAAVQALGNGGRRHAAGVRRLSSSRTPPAGSARVPIREVTT
jgi:hypothetical protein